MQPDTFFCERFDDYAWIVEISQWIKDEWSHIADISVPLEKFSLDHNQVRELDAHKYFDIVYLLHSNKHYAIWMVKGIYLFSLLRTCGLTRNNIFILIFLDTNFESVENYEKNSFTLEYLVDKS